jgi:glutamate/tyrosine decarboxylase-like PLP-dependent enzyme
MEHPLAMDAEAMRRAGYATVDALVARLADPGADPVLRRADATDMRARLGGPPPEQPGDYGAVLARVMTDVLPYAARTDHPGYLAFIPSFTTWPAALAELTAAAANLYCGAWMESAGATQIELEVVDWFRSWLGLPAGTAGVLVNGGSAGNLTALLVAREAVGGPSPDSVLYVSDQAHSSLARTARAMGLRPHQVRVLPTDGRWRLAPDTVAAAVRADRAAGRIPFALSASAGSTNTGAVDPLGDLADVCAAERLWLHVDAAYGGFAALTAKGRAALAGLDRADSVTLDPHKWLYQPMECGCVLIRDGARLERTFAIHPDYLDGDAVHGAGEVNFADRGLQLSRGFRALKVWMTVHTFGLNAFRACIQRNLELAEYAEDLVRGHPQLTLMAPATLGIVCFRREWPGCDEAETERRGTALADELERGGTALVSTTRLAGRYDVFIDARLIRTHGPGDHFGELAARDWGGGYGYARLATIRCAEPGRLLRLTSQDLQWLVDTQPTVKARLAVALAERLQNR